MQLDVVDRESCKHVFIDKVSGIKTFKPAFERLLDYARPGDTIVLWKSLLLEWVRMTQSAQ